MRDRNMGFGRIKIMGTSMVNRLKLIHRMRYKLEVRLVCKMGIIIVIFNLIIRRRWRSLIEYKNMRIRTNKMQRCRPRWST